MTVEVALGAVALRDAVVAGLADQEKQVFVNPLEMLGGILIVLADFLEIIFPSVVGTSF